MWKKIDKAIEKFNECLFLDPNNTDAMNDKGALFLLIKRNILEAISCFNNALALKPDSSMPLNNLGLAFDQFRCYFTAIGYFEECNRIDPLFTKAWYNLGRALDELGDRIGLQNVMTEHWTSIQILLMLGTTRLFPFTHLSMNS